MASVNVITALQQLRLEDNTPNQRAFATYRVATKQGQNVIQTPRAALELLDVDLGDPLSGLPDMRAVKPVVREFREAGQLRAYDIEWEYEQFAQFPQEPGDGSDPITNRIRKTSTLQWVDAWRRPLNSTENANDLGVGQLATSFQMFGNPPITKDGTGTGDIQGVPIDSNGEAASIAVYVQKIDITQDAETSAQEQDFDEFVGTRNDTTFLGRTLGSVVYTGHDLARDDTGLWQYVHHFSVDSALHARQVVYRERSTGKPKIGPVGLTPPPGVTSTSGYVGFGYPVYYIQPYPVRKSFNIFEL